MTEVFAVVVNYNGAPWLKRCLESLRQSDHPVRIIVVDNASGDESVAIARSIPGVEVIQQDRNEGFGRGNNTGIAHALRRGADFVFLLNQDAEVEPNTISRLVSFMRGRDDVGIASPVHLNDSGSLLDRNFLIYYLAPQAPEFVSEAYSGQLSASYRVSSVNAAAWLVSRRCLLEVGGFDPLFFMYGEDDDYCARARYHGFHCYIVSHARIRHARGFHQPEYRGGVWRRLLRSARFARAQTVRSLKDPTERSFLRSVYREVTALGFDGLSRSISALSPSPLLPSLLAAGMVCRELPRIARHKRLCRERGPTWLDFRIDPAPSIEPKLEPLPVRTAEPAMTEAAPLVTLGVPIYNGEQYLETSLDSLLAQTFRDFEIVISDNASDDRSAEICRGYAEKDARIRYIRHEVNRGAVWNHNFVIGQARGRFFRWHHADDLCGPNHLEHCVAALEADAGVVLAYPRTLLIDGGSRVTGRYDDGLHLSDTLPHVRIRQLLANIYLCNPVLGLIRTDALRRTAELGYYVRSDHVLLAELAMAGRWSEVPEALLYRRIHSGKSTSAYRSLNQRATWLDPRLRSKRFFWPNLRIFVEHVQAIRRARIGWREQLLCASAVTASHTRAELQRLRKRIEHLGHRLAIWPQTGKEDLHSSASSDREPQLQDANVVWMDRPDKLRQPPINWQNSTWAKLGDR
ncbi:MAG TPA: glycosyltransferase [Burkholderiales bacterium]|nr:glycosyltransferase [Burkholderiales bacterium]